MKDTIQQFCDKRSKEFDLIPEERKELIQKIAAYVKYKETDPVNLIFVCTHNSRRSMYGQIWAKVAAHYYGFNNVYTYSGGTEETAFHPNAIASLLKIGFDLVEAKDVDNPLYIVKFDDVSNACMCWSKKYDSPANPNENFGAVMTCSSADQNCPFIPGAELRIGLTYEDPKRSDGTSAMMETYAECSEIVCREMMYLFSISK